MSSVKRFTYWHCVNPLTQCNCEIKVFRGEAFEDYFVPTNTKMKFGACKQCGCYDYCHNLGRKDGDLRDYVMDMSTGQVYSDDGSPSQGTCPSGHPLTSTNASNATFTCDQCGSSIAKGAPTMSCRGCNYDLCYGCSNDDGATVEYGRQQSNDGDDDYEQNQRAYSRQQSTNYDDVQSDQIESVDGSAFQQRQQASYQQQSDDEEEDVPSYAAQARLSSYQAYDEDDDINVA